MRTTIAVAASLPVLVVFAGCGGSSHVSSTRAERRSATPVAATLTPEQRRMGRIVREWSRLLNAGDNVAIARLFRLPAVFVQGPFNSQFSTRRQIAVWHAELPCSSHVVSITYRRRSATAVFRLGNRGEVRCSGPGTLAAVRFEFVGGKIASWVQVPVPPGRRPKSLPA
jgi:hypothetical protein